MTKETNAKILTARRIGDIRMSSYYVDEDYPARPESPKPLPE